MRFNYLEPATVKEAVAMLTKCEGRAKILAGGTDLMVQMRAKALSPDCVVDITYIPGLDYIKYSAKTGLKIGALTPIRMAPLTSHDIHQTPWDIDYFFDFLTV